MIYHKDGSKPSTNEIFVFGSNLAGRHGLGAAKYAASIGAKYGVGTGWTSDRTFAIPTKGKHLEILSLLTIKPYVDSFVLVAKNNPNKMFFLTAFGTGLAGYSDADIVQLFDEFPENISYPDKWKTYIENK